MKTYDISEIASMLASRAEDVCRWLLPNGERSAGQLAATIATSSAWTISISNSV